MDQPDANRAEAPKRIFYQRLNRATAWFELSNATQFGDGLNKSRHSRNPFGEGLLRAIDGDTAEPVWIKYQWDGFGVRRGSDDHLPYWQVTLDTAAKWFPDNRQEPPDLWFEDRKRPSGPSNPMHISHHSNVHSLPRPGNPIDDESTHDSRRVPSLSQLVEAYQALRWFHQQMTNSFTPPFAQEQEVLPKFIQLANALRPLRPLIDKIDGWPTIIRRALPGIIGAFDAIASHWGWEQIAEPEAVRDAYLEQSRKRVADELERPMYEAALAISTQWDEPGYCRYDQMADEARKRGITSTMSLAEGLAKVEPARARFNAEPHIGKAYPELPEAEYKRIVNGLQALQPTLLELAPDRCTRPPWQQQPAQPRPSGPEPHSSRAPNVPQALMEPLKVIYPLHGIRTLASWQRRLSDVAGESDWSCRLDRWSYGKFTLLAFLTPWTREAKVAWLRQQYDAEINDRRIKIEPGQAPSVVAHSFGTYILGNALLRYDTIRFDKVILCGSILPVDFPWDKLIDRGQVQAVRHEYGARDPWVRLVHWFVGGTGSSGAEGFSRNHERLDQEAFQYDHSDYFGADHMKDRWMPFLNKRLPLIPQGKSVPVNFTPRTHAPWGLYAVVAVLLLLTAFLACRWI
jgi:hypothetical protein